MVNENLCDSYRKEHSGQWQYHIHGGLKEPHIETNRAALRRAKIGWTEIVMDLWEKVLDLNFKYSAGRKEIL